MDDYKEMFQERGYSEGFIECLRHIDRVVEIVPSLPEKEAAFICSRFTGAYPKPRAEASPNVEVSTEELDALLGRDSPDSLG